MTDLADALGLKLSTVSRVVHGNRLSIPVGQAIADHLGQPLEDLFPVIHAKKKMLQGRPRREKRPSVDLDELAGLRKACKHLLVDLALDFRGAYYIIATRLSESTGVHVTINSLSMALTGYRKEAGQLRLLRALHGMLKNWPQQAA